MMQLPELNPLGWEFYGAGDEGDLDRFEASLRTERHAAQKATHAHDTGCGEIFRPTGGVAAVFTEFPSNPLLKSPNLKRSIRQ